MTDKFFIKQQRKTVISTNKCTSSIEIGDCAIDQGFLLQFPGATLAIFLYLITHTDDRYIIETNPTIISSYLPNSYNLESIKEGLKYLEKHDIIESSKKRKGDYTYQIKINTNKLGKNLEKHEQVNGLNNKLHTDQNRIQANNKPQVNQNQKCIYYGQIEIRKKIIGISNPSRSELFQAILTFVSPEENINVLETTINQWLEDFDSNLIKELIRRVDKWLEKYNNPPQKAFRYLNGIIDDWYQKEIDTYQDLKYFDQLYRETRELAQMYGLVEWHNVKPVHMKTFHKWLNEDFPLSVDVVKLAIKEAFHRKRDGQPSLKYIEDNFIKPWKKKKVRSCQHAANLLKKPSTNTNSKKTPFTGRSANKTQGKWEDLSWDFEK